MAFAILSLFYFVLSLALFNGIHFKDILKKNSYQNISGKKLIGSVGLGIALSYIIIGIMFEIQSYPGADYILSIGIVSVGIIAIIAAVFYFKNKREAFYLRVFKRIVIYLIIGIILYFTPVNNAFNVDDQKQRVEQEQTG